MCSWPKAYATTKNSKSKFEGMGTNLFHQESLLSLGEGEAAHQKSMPPWHTKGSNSMVSQFTKERGPPDLPNIGVHATHGHTTHAPFHGDDHGALSHHGGTHNKANQANDALCNTNLSIPTIGVRTRHTHAPLNGDGPHGKQNLSPSPPFRDLGMGREERR
uniref:Uncharacterized protein n=1 Tax=Cannabis sativa TaxID=3483 RepID=A0A803Q2C6_CANSA